MNCSVGGGYVHHFRFDCNLLIKTIGFFPPLDNPAPDSRFRRWALQFRRRIRQKVLRLYLASSITSRFIVRQILYLTSFSDVWCVQLSISIKCVRLHA